MYNEDSPEPGLSKFHQQFCHDRRQELGLIKSHYKDGELKAISTILHRWKGYSRPYGFGFLGQIAEGALTTFQEKGTYGHLESTIAEIERYLDFKNKSAPANCVDFET